MAISYPLTLPTKGPRQMQFRGGSVVGQSVSPFSAESQVYAHQAEWWEVDVTLPPMKRIDAEPWVAFLLALNGKEGTFLLGDPVNTAPRGVGTGTPLVKGASQTGKTLLTDGWTAGQTGIMKAGDWFQFGSGSSSRLHKVVQDANSDGSGNATLEIWPRLRESPADNAPIVVSSPKGVFRLSSNVREWALERAGFYAVSFTAREVL